MSASLNGASICGFHNRSELLDSDTEKMLTSMASLRVTLSTETSASYAESFLIIYATGCMPQVAGYACVPIHSVATS